MRILFVVESFPLPVDGTFEVTGGVEATALRVARWLSARHDVAVVTNRRQPPWCWREPGFAVVQCGRRGRYRFSGGWLERLSFRRAAVVEGVALRPDVVVGWNFVAYAPAARIARACGVPAVAWYADVWIGRWTRLFGPAGLAGEWLERRALRQPWRRVVAISEPTRERLAGAGVDEDRIEVIPPVVATLAAAPAPGAALPAGGPRVCVVSRLVPYKRVDLVLGACARLLARWPGLAVNVIGDGPERRRLEALARRLGVAVYWMGRLPDHESVLREMAGSAAYATASEVEGFGIGVLEAAGCGRPYAAADIPAVRFATRGGIGGRLFAPGDEGACAAALDAALGDAALRAAAATEGPRLAAAYAAGRICPPFESVLQRAVQEGRP